MAAGVIAATPPAALAMILFTITTLAADPAQFDASSGGAALFAAAGVDATTASFDEALRVASDDDVKFRDEYRYTVGSGRRSRNTRPSFSKDRTPSATNQYTEFVEGRIRHTV